MLLGVYYVMVKNCVQFTWHIQWSA